jgi:hypothetical protein
MKQAKFHENFAMFAINAYISAKFLFRENLIKHICPTLFCGNAAPPTPPSPIDQHCGNNLRVYIFQTTFEVLKIGISKNQKDGNVRYRSGGSMKLNACILILAHMVYL